MSTSELSTDYWLETGLEQPKLEIANYVESTGIPVPRRFQTLEEARGIVADGGQIILRSEHPGDYTGASGLASSVKIDQGAIEYGKRIQSDFDMYFVDDVAIRTSADKGTVVPKQYGGPGYGQVEDMIVGNILTSDPDETLRQLLLVQKLTSELPRYAMLNGHNVDDFMSEASFSFWELIDGTNVTIVADDIVDGQYHAFAFNHTRERTRYDGVVLNGGVPVRTSVSSSDQFTPELSSKVIDMYEKVRNLPRFSSDHCPIVELQVDTSGKVWFLQYHRSRDFNPNVDSLNPADYPEEEGWIKAESVRGSVGSLATLQTALWYPDWYQRPPASEDASLDFHYDSALSDIMSPRRRAFFNDQDWGQMYAELAVSHEQRVKWFKPETALTFGYRGFTRDVSGRELVDRVSSLVIKRRCMARIAVDTATDGVSGYVRLNKDVEQPVLTNN